MGLSSIVRLPGTSSGSAENPRKSSEEVDRAPEGAGEDDTEVLDEEPKNMLLALVSQLRIGMDLSKITLPVFVLEPRSMLERVTDFHSHPELLHGVDKIDSPEDRFIQVLRYYLGGWHIKPRGVKKPYNPVLGEFFRCRYDYPDGTAAYYVAEQVSHHPPISAWCVPNSSIAFKRNAICSNLGHLDRYFSSPENGLDICGELRPKSKFLGNSAATIMEGETHVILMNKREDGEYHITMPNMYARGILFGKMVLELGDTSIVKNEENDITCDVEFKTKGFFSGTYNAIAGKIKGPKGEIGEISGTWNEKMDIHRKGFKGKETLFDASTAKITQKVVAPEDKQSENESRRLWSKVTAAIKKSDLDAATDAKTVIEDAQREAVRRREEEGATFKPRFFELTGENEYRPIFKVPIDKSAKEQRQAVRDFIYGDDFEPETK
ncbi:BZ3500_MvSof-1268-A1-R1_Chr1-1g00865 [Microbotryum saponariae]|uniref:BZ3500_MvSof-1268-A1-R1_Chr1-1g00865 protein n=1 Tax=Microbotryum saponariae TaxID=289078 RepID=A0A2X0KJ94_9BASI|nr:BZ3500_MvSof-1268-A1-R1_Chr1-1g00865 [Microbotryum saponariae]SCZ92807.1 BZ3501_MvSof-1269-A2-R1_Chr1-1g00462 [Microbotryum saponariae]